MKTFFHKLFWAGTQDLDDSKSQNIYISNIVALAFSFGIAAPYIYFTQTTNPWLTWLPIAGLIVGVIGYLLNRSGLNVIGRVLITVLPSALIIYYGSSVMGTQNEVSFQSAVMAFSFSFLPFLVFSFEEKLVLWLSVGINFFLVLFYPEIKDIIEPKETIDETILFDPVIAFITKIFGVFIGFFSVGILGYLTHKSRIKTKTTIEELGEKEQTMARQKEDLQKTLDEIEKAKKEDQKRSWINDGMVEFAQVMRNNNGDELYGKLINGMVSYLDAKLGAIYEANEENGETFLTMKGCYAYDREKAVDGQKIYPGEGLVGQCFLEKKKIYMTNVPQGFPKIKSGLGDATPNAVIIVPLMTEEKVEGIIEFAGFKEYEPHEVEFIEKIGETIATTISREKINSRTTLLLEESKSQAEVLQQQEEEMRQNMEEMKATQDMMDSREKDFITEIKQLKQRIKELESQE